MKNKLYNNLILAILVVLFCTTNFAFAGTTPLTQMKPAIIKFTLAMLSVGLFSFLIFLGLSLYNRFFVASQIKDYKLRKDSLRTPRDDNEAIIMFITKNRLR